MKNFRSIFDRPQGDEASQPSRGDKAPQVARRYLAIQGTESCPQAMRLVGLYGLARSDVTDIRSYGKPGPLAQAPTQVQKALQMCVDAGSIRGPEVTQYALCSAELQPGQSLYFVLSQSPRFEGITAFVGDAL